MAEATNSNVLSGSPPLPRLATLKIQRFKSKGFKPSQASVNEVSKGIAGLVAKEFWETFTQIEGRIQNLETKDLSLMDKNMDCESKISQLERKLQIIHCENSINNEKISILETQILEKDAQIEVIDCELDQMREKYNDLCNSLNGIHAVFTNLFQKHLPNQI